MAKYRKRPVVIEAQRFNWGDREKVAAWSGALVTYDATRVATLEIDTLEGIMRADLGDWIIQGVQGEFYPCKPDIFAEIYELVVDGT